MASSPEQLVRSQVLLREVNERIAEIASSAAGDLPEFLCECSRDDCTETLALSLAEYERVRLSPNLFVILPGHDWAGGRSRRRDEARLSPGRDNEAPGARLPLEPNHVR